MGGRPGRTSDGAHPHDRGGAVVQRESRGIGPHVVGQLDVELLLDPGQQVHERERVEADPLVAEWLVADHLRAVREPPPTARCAAEFATCWVSITRLRSACRSWSPPRTRGRRRRAPVGAPCARRGSTRQNARIADTEVGPETVTAACTTSSPCGSCAAKARAPVTPGTCSSTRTTSAG